MSRASYDIYYTNGWREGVWYKNISFTYLIVLVQDQASSTMIYLSLPPQNQNPLFKKPLDTLLAQQIVIFFYSVSLLCVGEEVPIFLFISFALTALLRYNSQTTKFTHSKYKISSFYVLGSLMMFKCCLVLIIFSMNQKMFWKQNRDIFSF